ncbi:hypothetical protein D3C87_102900 [compost metagenome]
MKNIIVKAINKKDFNNTQPSELVEMIFDDLLALLRFIHQAKKDGALKGSFQFTSQIDYLDSCWHHFILYTAYYYKFCFEEFGEYLHHMPEEETSGDPGSERATLSQVIEDQISLIEKYLGVDFAHRIFFIYPEILKMGAQSEL